MKKNIVCAVLAIAAAFMLNTAAYAATSAEGGDDIVAQAKEKTSEGKMFSDLDLVTFKGKSAKLSDYVGKGKYVLVDFWASWCGWCIKEMPTLAKVHGMTDKLIVLGVNLDKNKEAAEEAVNKNSMIWKQVILSNINDVTTVYGVTGIPETVLFAPDGKILKRSLRGEELVEFVSNNIK